MFPSYSTSAVLVALLGAGSLVAGVQAPLLLASPLQAVVTPDDPVFAQDAPDAPAPEPVQADDRPAQVSGRGRGLAGQPRPYGQVVTSDARTDEGVFRVHRVRDAVYYEIPTGELGRDFLWVTKIKRTTLGAGYGGQPIGDRLVRWELSGNRVFLRQVNYAIVAAEDTPMARAVADANHPVILRTFNVLAFSEQGNPVIDVTGLFLSEVPELSVRRTLGARGFDSSRAFVEKVVSFPANVNVQVTQTYTTPIDAAGGRGGMRATSGTVVVFHSMIKLPETPMTARLADSRVGYFSTSTYDYGREEHKAVRRSFITRYRLEKRNPRADVSDPVDPIVYYVDPATPAKFVDYVKRGIEDWQPAFEAAGFSNAIVAREAPGLDEDPDWDPEDVRYSVVRWLPSTVENASGPNTHDPRSGEILDADVQFHHNVQNLLTMWYFVQVGALDPRAQQLPLPDDLVGRLIQHVVTHEIGHTLGLQHNMKASSLYSIDQVRDSAWVRENGHTPTLMDYSRFNYVAQPEDGIAVDDLIPKIGPYDKWAIMWGYKPIPGAATPDAERATLDAWAREQDEKPYLRFTTFGSGGADPGELSEAVGDADAVEATRLGLKNLERVARLLVPAATRPGEPYADLAETYGRLVGQWRLEMGHVASIVGGFDSRELHSGQPGVRFMPIRRARQQAAVQFLLEQGFAPPLLLTDTDVLRRIEPSGVINRIRVAQHSLLNALLAPARLDRLVEQGALESGAYSPLELLADLRAGLWRELRSPAVATSIYRRNVQRAHLETIDNRLNGSSAPSAEVRALLRGELRTIDRQIAAALPGVTDVATRRHLQDARDMIAASLDPRAMRQQAGETGAGRGGGSAIASGPAGTLFSHDAYDYDSDPFLADPETCWPDVVIW